MARLRRYLLSFLLISGWLLARPALARAQRPPALTLTIIPSTYSSRDSPQPSIWFTGRGHFHVLLTNVSAQPVTLFEEWNSWGYYGLSFELTYPNGRHVALTRAARSWDRNFPSTFTLAPQGHYVFEVRFDHTWEPSPRAKLPPGQASTCRLRASYSLARQAQDPLASRKHEPAPWTGTVTSPEGTYLIWP